MQRLLRLLSDPTRLRILLALEGEELAVNEIAEVLNMGQSRISNHLRLLREAEALAVRHEGSWTFYRNALPAGPRHSQLWAAVRKELRKDETFRADEGRRKTVLERRRRRSREHFASGDGGNGPEARLECGSLREEIVAALAPAEWVVVDAGCGDGFLTEVLADRFSEVHAFDHSPERLAAARERVDARSVTFEPGEIDDLPLEDASVDALCLSMVLHHVPEITAVLAEAHRVLQPGGRLVVADLAPHDDETMRERMGDLRLGLDPEAIVEAMRTAGFRSVRVLPVNDRLLVNRCRPLDLILVAGCRAPDGRARKRNQRKTKAN